MKKKAPSAKSAKVAKTGRKAAKRRPRDAEPIEEKIKRIFAGVPRAEWDRLPEDASDRLDHYLYGAPKR